MVKMGEEQRVQVQWAQDPATALLGSVSTEPTHVCVLIP